MTRRGGRDASERRSGIGEDENELVMARPAARWRRSHLVMLVTLKKGNHLCEAYMRSRKAEEKLYTEERGTP